MNAFRTVIILLLMFLVGCRNGIAKLPEYENVIIQSSLIADIPHLQSISQKELFMKHRVKSMSFVNQRVNTTVMDSIAFLEFDFGGRLISRTTKENTTQGCLPFMIKQIFSYNKSLLKKVTNYSFKYKTNSVLNKWMERDTSRLRMFDWEDYTYKGDTTIVESGASIAKYINDEQGNIIKRIERMKSNNQIANFNYKYIDSSITSEMETKTINGPSISNYLIDKNKVQIKSNREGKNYFEENVYDSLGFLTSIIRYNGNEQQSITAITYNYYL